MAPKGAFVRCTAADAALQQTRVSWLASRADE
jgi:hypothetical protein